MPKPTDIFDTVFTIDKDPNDFLPEYCIDTKQICPIKEINGIDAKILKRQRHNGSVENNRLS